MMSPPFPAPTKWPSRPHRAWGAPHAEAHHQQCARLRVLYERPMGVPSFSHFFSAPPWQRPDTAETIRGRLRRSRPAPARPRGNTAAALEPRSAPVVVSQHPRGACAKRAQCRDHVVRTRRVHVPSGQGGDGELGHPRHPLDVSNPLSDPGAAVSLGGQPVRLEMESSSSATRRSGHDSLR